MRSLLAIRDALSLSPRNVLEVAAGGGGLAACLAARGCAVTANDLRADLLAEEINNYVSKDNIKVAGGNMFELSPQHIGKFDLIIACEVIEHVAHPDELLRHLKKFLLPEGRILLTTPNGAYSRSRLPNYSEIRDFDKLEGRQFMPDADGHLFLFTPQELCNLTSSVGLEVERLNVWGTPLLSGHYGLRYAMGRFSPRVSYQAEKLAQRLMAAVRERLCCALSAVLRLAPTPSGASA